MSTPGQAIIMPPFMSFLCIPTFMISLRAQQAAHWFTCNNSSHYSTITRLPPFALKIGFRLIVSRSACQSRTLNMPLTRTSKLQLHTSFCHSHNSLTRSTTGFDNASCSRAHLEQPRTCRAHTWIEVQSARVEVRSMWSGDRNESEARPRETSEQKGL